MFGKKKILTDELRKLAAEIGEEAEKEAAADGLIKSFRSKFRNKTKGATGGKGKKTLTSVKYKPPSAMSPTLTKVKK